MKIHRLLLNWVFAIFLGSLYTFVKYFFVWKDSTVSDDYPAMMYLATVLGSIVFSLPYLAVMLIVLLSNKANPHKQRQRLMASQLILSALAWAAFILWGIESGSGMFDLIPGVVGLSAIAGSLLIFRELRKNA